MKVEKVFLNGFIYTANKSRSVVDAIAITNGRIVHVGSNKSVQAFIGDKTEVIDLDQKLMLPAFIDGHCHFSISVESACGVDLKEYNTQDDYTATLAKFYAEHPETRILRGKGFLEAVFPGRGPRKEWLDKISRDIPIVIYFETFHSVWVNSKALKLAKITKDTPDPANGRIERDDNGEPWGCLREEAKELIFNVLPDYSIADYEKAILYYQDIALKLGFSMAYDPWIDMRGRNAIEAAKNLDAKGLLTMDLRAAYWADPKQDVEQIKLLESQRAGDDIGSKFSINAVKFFTDGIIEAGTARLTVPYAGELMEKENEYGDQNWETERLNRVMAAADKARFQIHTHSIGDGAVRQCLDAFEYIRHENGISDNRHVISHATLCHKDDLPRFKQLGVGVMLNVYWAEIDDNILTMRKWIGEDYHAPLYQINSYFKSGALVTNASDYPVTAVPLPFIGLEIGVTRLPPENYHPWVLDMKNPAFKIVPDPEECADLYDLVDSFTINQAYQNYVEFDKGSLEVNKHADFIICDQNIFKISAFDIGKTQVQKTWLRGELVHKM
ncbi:amidohydrolase [Yokenella regensburgei]|uniref:amidohydrolase n=1 Tax=Yokenella regensburgei TaxID=158877 RepID=UPI001375BE17|nr:amidohydrolase [Yokenella regensburgei]KAF1366691.1 hypothetical protein FHR25_004839 [Yokenella regensburgei]